MWGYNNGWPIGLSQEEQRNCEKGLGIYQKAKGKRLMH